MKTFAVTIRLDPKLKELLDDVCNQSGRARSDVLREAFRRHLSITRFEQVRRQVQPFAEAAARDKNRSTT